MGGLSPSERRVLIEKVRGLVQRDLDAGIAATEKALCHHCGHTKPLAGAVRYGRYRLCNDCAVRYEIAAAEGDVRTIEDFVIS